MCNVTSCDIGRGSQNYMKAMNLAEFRNIRPNSSPFWVKTSQILKIWPF